MRGEVIDQRRFKNFSAAVNQHGFGIITPRRQGKNRNAVHAKNADGRLSDRVQDDLRRRIGTKLALESRKRVEELGANRKLAILGRKLSAHSAQLFICLRQCLLIKLGRARLAETKRLSARLDGANEVLQRLLDLLGRETNRFEQRRPTHRKCVVSAVAEVLLAHQRVGQRHKIHQSRISHIRRERAWRSRLCRLRG